MKRKRERKGGRAAAPKRRGKRVENKENTRRAILQAALDLFAEKGFYRTTTKAISKKAGIAEGTLFNYFETKEDLALYFFEESLTEMIEWYQSNRGMKREYCETDQSRGDAVCRHCLLLPRRCSLVEAQLSPA